MLAAFGIYLAASSLSASARSQTELGFRDDSHTSLVAILDEPGGRARLRCGPVSVPDHKLRARRDVILLNARPSGVIDRSEARHYHVATGAQHGNVLWNAEQYGVAIYPLGLAVVALRAGQPADNPLDQVLAARLPARRTTQYYAAYVRCRA